jgi:xylulokinase
MQLLDIPNRCWSDEILSKLDIDKSLLGKVYESPEITGVVSPEAARLTGLAVGTIVVGGAGDNAAAAVGTGVVLDGKAFTTIGSSGVVFSHTSKLAIDKKGRVHTFCCAIPGAWHVMGVTQAAGLSLKWFRDNFCSSEMDTARLIGVDPYVLMNEEVKNTPIGANKLFYLPYLNGERTPHLDPNARGVFFGLSVMHTRAELIRAIMEGVSYSLTDCVEVMREMNISFTKMSICGGGAHSPIWRQMLADLYGCEVNTLSSEEGPALGVAILAAVGAGIYKSVPEACEKIIKTDKTQGPVEANTRSYKKLYEFYKSLYPALKDSYTSLAKL